MRFIDWLRFDPHPPIYFRVRRLSKIAAKGGEIKHALLLSIRASSRGSSGPWWVRAEPPGEGPETPAGRREGDDLAGQRPSPVAQASFSR